MRNTRRNWTVVPLVSMPVVHVTHGDLLAAICPMAGLAIVPDRLVVYKFRCTNPGDVDQCNHPSVLRELPWEMCVKVELSESTELVITLDDQQSTPVIAHFQALVGPHLKLLKRVCIMQDYWRRALCRLRTRKELDALVTACVMALHPRLGANSPITVEILQMAATYWLV
jgi:hypothetical protein